MTRNQLTYHQNLETIRSNKAREEETRRHNLREENETNRSNVAKEFTNKYVAQETARSNQAREQETERHNRKSENTENVKAGASVASSIGSLLKGMGSLIPIIPL